MSLFTFLESIKVNKGFYQGATGFVINSSNIFNEKPSEYLCLFNYGLNANTNPGLAVKEIEVWLPVDILEKV